MTPLGVKGDILVRLGLGVGVVYVGESHYVANQACKYSSGAHHPGPQNVLCQQIAEARGTVMSEGRWLCHKIEYLEASQYASRTANSAPAADPHYGVTARWVCRDVYVYVEPWGSHHCVWALCQFQ